MELAVAAADASCIRCLIESGESFFVGRPGMGAPEDSACAVATRRTPWNDSEVNWAHFWSKERFVLKSLNGVLTTSNEDARNYARCYAAAINMSDLIVRIGGGPYMPLRKPLTVCSKPGSKHFHKSDILLSQSGHFPQRVIAQYALSPWMIVADAQHPSKHLVGSGLDQHVLASASSQQQRLQSSSRSNNASSLDDAVGGGGGSEAEHADSISNGEGEGAGEISEVREVENDGERATGHGHSHDQLQASGSEEQRLLAMATSWLYALRGKTVLVVHPFNRSISSQLSKGGRALWGPYAHRVMPAGIRFKVVAAPQNLARATESRNWQEALDTLVERVDAAGAFDLALLSCGGLGMLLGAHLRATNRSSMYVGADLQILFGIYGRRWGAGLAQLNLSFVRQAWVRPAPSEVPAGSTAVEGGTYW